MGTYNAAILWPNGSAYFFAGSQYYKFEISRNGVPGGYPLPVQRPHWEGLEDAATMGIQAAVVWPGDKKAYFFCGSRYFVYDIGASKVDPGYPRSIAGNWPGILEGNPKDHHIDAAIAWPNGAVYLFQDDRYYRITVNSAHDDPDQPKHIDSGYPLPIKDHWPGLWAAEQPPRAGFVWPVPVNGRQVAYFFHFADYVRYDIGNNRVDTGYPQPISGNWPGL
jgi:hypothetical protein